MFKVADLSWINFPGRNKKPQPSSPTVEIRLVLLSVGLLTLAVLPHFNHIQAEIILIFLGFASWRCFAARFLWLPRNRWVIYLFAIIGFTVAAWYYGAPLGRDPGVAFLVIMLGLKCMEMSSRRDVSIVILLGLFMVVTHFLYADGIWWSAPLLALVAALAWLMAQMEHVEPGRYIGSDIKLVAKMLVQALPFVIILFYLFPRLAGSVYLFQSEQETTVTGLNDTLTMGSVSNLIQSDDIAFTASFFDQEAPPPEKRYWRGSVLWFTDGRHWTRGLGRAGSFLKQPPLSNSDGVTLQRYQIDLESSAQNWLFSLDYPVLIPTDAEIDVDHHLYVKRKPEAKFSYSLGSSYAPLIEPLNDPARMRSLDPGNTIVTPRLEKLINQFKQGAQSQSEIVRRVLQHYRDNEFIYTLQPPLLKSNAPVDEFLFDSRRGFCGHYASSFATIMRIADIPARLVVGYLGGEHNPRTNKIVVRQSDAHAWVEIWQAESGWNRVDPTVAIAPDRIQFPIDFNTSINSEGSVLFSIGNFRGLAIELEWFKDSIKAAWNRWFTAFDQDTQKQLLKFLGLDQLDTRLLSIGSFIGALGLLTMLSLVLFYRDRVKPDMVVQIYRKFCRKMQKAGLSRHPSEGPVDFSNRAERDFPHLKNQICRITQQFIDLRYGTSGVEQDKTKISRFKQTVANFQITRVVD